MDKYIKYLESRIATIEKIPDMDAVNNAFKNGQLVAYRDCEKILNDAK